jgi:hypothetical protein
LCLLFHSRQLIGKYKGYDGIAHCVRAIP